MSIRTLGDVVTRRGPRPSISEDDNVYSLASVLASAHVDAVPVLSSSSNTLIGIATSSDVTKCMARGEHFETTRVSQIMTAHPVTLPPTETPANAMALMREGRFRHIPIVSDDNNSVLGIVDVLHLAYDAITRLQVSYSMIPTRHAFEFMRAARDKIEKPTLRPIVSRCPLATLTRENYVIQACETLIREHLSAIVIVDDKGILDGIFTCRDIVNRVIMKGLSPYTTRLGQVMTPNPDCAHQDFTILESLQRMQACSFRHLPVVDSHSRVVVGLVDVLQLASDALSGLETIAERSGSRGDSMDSAVRETQPVSRGLGSFFTSLFSSAYTQKETPIVQTPRSLSNFAAPPSYLSKEDKPLSYMNSRRHRSNLGSDRSFTRPRLSNMDTPLASFKFMDVNGEWRRIKVPMDIQNGMYDQFLVDVRRRYAGSTASGSVKIKYIDEDGDAVLISNDEDLASCFEDFAGTRNKTIQLKVSSIERPSSSQMQSPISSNPSSALGSPRESGHYSTTRREVPPARQSERADLLPENGMNSRDMSWARRPEVLTPSQKKTAEAHRQVMENRPSEAIQLFDEALKLDPENARAQGGRGAARLFSGNSVGAEEDYRAAISLVEAGKSGAVGDLTFQMCVVGLVESLIDQRRYEEAVAVADRMDPSSGNVGCIDAFRDELDSAGGAAREALDSEEYGDASSCYTNALRVEAAYLKLVPSEAPRPSLRLGRAKCYKAMEDFDMALEDYEAAVEIDPESVAGHKGCGKCLAELEQMDRALEAYQRAQKLDLADEEVKSEIEAIRKVLPDPLDGKKEQIAKLGALLGGLNLPGKTAK